MVKSAMASPNSDTAQIGTDSFKYKGVRKRKWGKWVSEIRLPNSRDRIWLGSYDSPEKAARAFDAALYYLRGSHANFNFPDTPLQIHVAADHHDQQSPTPQEIQVLAARFANHHQHQVSPHKDFSEHGASFHSDRVTLTETASTSCTSSSSMYNDIDGTLQLDHADTRSIDWSFLNSLDSNEVGSDYAFYSGLDNVHSGDFELYPTPPVTFELNAEDNESDDAISLLWNFGYEWL